jgi:hypothetical protein
MDLDDHEAEVTDFTSESPLTNMWTLDDGHDDHKTDDKDSSGIVTSTAEDELERPSFLRRLKKRRNESADDSDESTPDKKA